MSSPLPVNAKHNYHQQQQNRENYNSSQLEEGGLAGSFDRNASIARLSSSPVPPNVRSASPPRSISSSRSYGTTDLENVTTTSSGGGLFRPLSTPTYNYDDNTVSVDLPEDQVARVVKRHLVETSPAASILQKVSTNHSTAENSEGDTYSTASGSRIPKSVHQLPGGAITHDIYKWAEDADAEQAKRSRSQSVYIPRQEPSDPALARLRDPGGFRRHFVYDQAQRQGKEPPHWMTRTFVDFLALYGHFGGEDLSDSDDDDETEEEGEPGEQTGLLRRRRRRQNAVPGTASPAKAVFLLLKAFVGTGVMFLPKAFYNGGIFFSTTLLSAIALISLYSFLLLVETRNKVPVSFGDIGGILYGRSMRIAALIEALSNCEVHVPLPYLILGEVAVFVPIAMIRKIQKLSSSALIADIFIMMGLLYLYYYDFLTLATHGIGNVEWIINPQSFPMFIGTAVFTYEGVGLVIPITESMKEPEKFGKVLSYTMLGITLIFLSVGFISYMAFGDKVQTVILLNFPTTPIVNTIQALYAMAICLSIPLQLFPAIRIIETALFTRSGKHNPVVKWQKNAFRLAAVLVCSCIAIAGSDDLDKFVSLVGSLCCVPLCFLFPPLFHYKAMARTFTAKAINIAIIIFGVVSMTYTTGITIALWSAGGEEAPISRCTPNGN
ncbi:transmembrane amino acid transporter protein-domain-containing protein [Circinella umbellata]|nr:transmembrane amino acid transporter protein-domain-containing protein [Circinella umbellata]